MNDRDENRILKDIHDGFEASGEHLSDDFLNSTELFPDKKSGPVKRNVIIWTAAVAACAAVCIISVTAADRLTDRDRILTAEHQESGTPAYSAGEISPEREEKEDYPAETDEKKSSEKRDETYAVTEAYSGKTETSDNYKPVTEVKETDRNGTEENTLKPAVTTIKISGTAGSEHTVKETPKPVPAVTKTEAVTSLSVKETPRPAIAPAVTKTESVPSQTVKETQKPQPGNADSPTGNETPEPQITSVSKPAGIPDKDSATFKPSAEDESEKYQTDIPESPYMPSRPAEEAVPFPQEIPIMFPVNPDTRPVTVPQPAAPEAEISFSENIYWTAENSMGAAVYEDEKFVYTVMYPDRYMVNLYFPGSNEYLTYTLDGALKSGKVTIKRLSAAGLPFCTVSAK